MKRIGCFLLLLMLCVGCTSKPASKEIQGDVYTVKHEKDGTAYTVAVTEDSDSHRSILLYDLKSNLLQTIPVENDILAGIELQDVNLDGYTDIVANTGGTLNEGHELYVWDASSQNFTKIVFEGFDLLSYFEVYEGYIKNWAKETADSGFVQTLIWEGNTLIMDSEEHYEAGADDTDTITGNADAHDLTWAKAEFAKQDFEPDIIYPISHILTQYITPVGDCMFVLHGFYGVELKNEENPYSVNYINTMINSIEIRAINGDFYQLIDGLFTLLRPYVDNYGFKFGDWNADGVMDLKLQELEGGSMRNEPSLFWLWNNEQAMFVENKQLREISDSSTVYFESQEDNRLCSYTHIGPEEYAVNYYEYEDGSFIRVETKYGFDEKQDDGYYRVTQILRPIDGEMKVVEENKVKLE